MYQRYENESDEELIFRICSEKEQIGSWQNVADVLNELLNNDYGESTYRKKFQAFQKMLDANQSKFVSADNQLEEIKLQQRELNKERVKFRDERNAYQKLIREEARKESYLDMVKDIICNDVDPYPYNEKENTPMIIGTNDLLIPLSDIHTGIEIDNFKNTFNEKVLAERLNNYLTEIISIRNTHHSENAYVVIGEICSGLIHNNLRIQNNLDLMEQFKYINKLIASMLIVLSEHFKVVHIYVTPGNHSRISPKKEDSLAGENMDILVPFYLKAKLQNYSSIIVHDNTINSDIAMFNIRGKKIFSAHGDKDSPASVVQNWTMMFGQKPDIVLLGHRHKNGLSTVYDTKVIQTGCVSGSDEYSISIRKVNKPEQMISVISDRGLECTYDITLD